MHFEHMQTPASRREVRVVVLGVCVCVCVLPNLINPCQVLDKDMQKKKTPIDPFSLRHEQETQLRLDITHTRTTV